jgi:putative membrane protein
VKRACLLTGLALLPLGSIASDKGMTGHMVAHMTAVAIAAPLIAFGISGTRADPAFWLPRIVAPMAMMLLELTTVWLWHLPALRAAAHGSWMVTAIEQACFFVAGLLLWSSVLHAPQRIAGIGALLLTSMHMTLLGVLIGLAPRPLYVHHGTYFGLGTLADQQLGGVVMLVVGAASYMIGGLVLLAELLKARKDAPV